MTIVNSTHEFDIINTFNWNTKILFINKPKLYTLQRYYSFEMRSQTFLLIKTHSQNEKPFHLWQNSDEPKAHSYIIHQNVLKPSEVDDAIRTISKTRLVCNNENLATTDNFTDRTNFMLAVVRKRKRLHRKTIIRFSGGSNFEMNYYMTGIGEELSVLCLTTMSRRNRYWKRVSHGFYDFMLSI